MNWDNLFEFVGGGVVLMGAISYLGKVLIEHVFSKELSKFSSAIEIENFKHKTTFEKLHTERAVVIKEVYKKLVITQRKFESLMNPLQMAGEPTEEQKKKDASESFNDFWAYFDQNKIFFEKSLAEKIEKFVSELRHAWYDFIYRNEQDIKDRTRIWSEVWKRLNKEIPELKEEVENQFRLIIGIEEKVS